VTRDKIRITSRLAGWPAARSDIGLAFLPSRSSIVHPEGAAPLVGSTFEDGAADRVLFAARGSYCELAASLRGSKSGSSRLVTGPGVAHISDPIEGWYDAALDRLCRSEAGTEKLCRTVISW
jgi:hypothetical protein